MRNKRNTSVYETRICQHCGKQFSFKSSQQNSRSPGKFCSCKCKIAAQTRKITKQCAKCGKEFRLSPSVAHRRFCSGACAGNQSTKETRVCVVCKEPFVCQRNAKKLCCSRACSVIYRTGRTSRTLLDDGTARFHYSTYEWRIARKKAIARDITCVRCGSDYRLSVHHIRAWEESRDDSLDNLMTLCGHCHPIVEAAIRYH